MYKEGSQSRSRTTAGAVGEAVKAATETTTELAKQVSAKASELTDVAYQPGKTFESGLERIGRQNPFGAIAGAVMVGVVFGLLARR